MEAMNPTTIPTLYVMGNSINMIMSKKIKFKLFSHSLITFQQCAHLHGNMVSRQCNGGCINLTSYNNSNQPLVFNPAI